MSRCCASARHVTILLCALALGWVERRCLADGPAAAARDLRTETAGAARSKAPHADSSGWRAVRRPIDEAAPTADPTHVAPPDRTPERASLRNREHSLSAASQTSDRLVIAAQSPDDDQGQPVWHYPSRRVSSTVGVPRYGSHSSAGRERVQVASSLARTQQWQPADRGDQFDDVEQPPMADPPAHVQPFHDSPFQSSPFDPYPASPVGPACPVAPGRADPCAPTDPFADPCLAPGLNYCDYSWNNLYLFALVEGFRQADADDERLAGRFGFNWALPAFDDQSGLSWQGGFSGSVAEQGPQFFATGGLFYRGDMRNGAAWNGGAVVDWMQDNAFDTDVAQVRAKTSITLDPKNEIGVWGAVGIMDDDKGGGRAIETVDQANLFYRYLFNRGWDLTGWVGWRSDPSSAAIGGDLSVPLGESWAITGGGHYAFEGDSWDAHAGVARYFGRRARQQYLGQYRHLPYLSVADNTSMTLFLDR